MDYIFRNLVDTTRTLRLRQNEVKLWLYRHFTNTLLLCIVLSVIFFLWSLKTHSFNECIVVSNTLFFSFFCDALVLFVDGRPQRCCRKKNMAMKISFNSVFTVMQATILPLLRLPFIHHILICPKFRRLISMSSYNQEQLHLPRQE